MSKADNTVQGGESIAEDVSKISSANSIQVLSRAADILRVLKADNGGLSLGQIANRVDLPRSTVQRIVNALISERFIRTSATEGGLRLGPEIQSLALAIKFDIVEVLRPILIELSQVTGETVDLAVLRDNQLEFIDQVEGTHRLRTVSAVGEVFPLTDTANGKAVLSLMSEADATILIEKEMREKPKANDKAKTVLNELISIKMQGYSLDCDDHTVGISAVGVAFADHAGVLHAISIPVPSQRFNEKKEQLIKSLLLSLDETINILQ